MKVQAQHTRKIDVELSRFTIDDVTRENIIKHFNLPPWPEIIGDDLYRVWEEDWGHSSSFEKEKVRKATPEDKAAVTVLMEMGLVR